MGLLGFTPKLRLAPLWPALAAAVIATLVLWILLPGLFAESAATQLLDTLEILSPIFQHRLDSGDHDVQTWVKSVAGPEAGLRITLIASDGKVLADSAAPNFEKLDNHATRPEVRAALATGSGHAVRHSATLDRTFVYAARTLTATGGHLVVLRLAQPLSRLEDLRGSLAIAMLLAVLAAAAAGLGVSLWLDRRLFRPLAELIGGAGELASGRYEARLGLPEADELADLAVALNRLGATVQGQFAALRHERDHLKAILSGMSEGVLVVGADGRALLANPAFHRLFALTGEVTGRAVLELVRLPGLDHLVVAALGGGTPEAIQVETGGIEKRTFQLAGSALSEDGGSPTGAVIVGRETTEFTRLMEMRRDFVANVSHELKTPLAAIRGYAETLRDGALDEPATALRFTERVLSQCARLQLLLDDLLTLSRLESLEGAPHREPVDLAGIVHRAADLVSPSARERQVTVAIEDSAPVILSGDALGLERLVVNLLDNAIKYNKTGGSVTVRLGTAAEGDGLLEVTDTGIGIPPEALARIFERFYRVDKGRARAEGGTGLGLAIVKHVAQAHGGQVDVASRIGQGTTFRVRLPLDPG